MKIAVSSPNGWKTLWEKEKLLLFPQCFQETCTAYTKKPGLVWERVKKKIYFLEGNTGEGKTTTAIALMVSLFDEDECLLVSSPDHWQSIDTRAVRIVLLDDIFGAGSLDEKLMLQWSARFSEVVFFTNYQNFTV